MNVGVSKFWDFHRNTELVLCNFPNSFHISKLFKNYIKQNNSLSILWCFNIMKKEKETIKRKRKEFWKTEKEKLRGRIIMRGLRECELIDHYGDTNTHIMWPTLRTTLMVGNWGWSLEYFNNKILLSFISINIAFFFYQTTLSLKNLTEFNSTKVGYIKATKNQTNWNID